MKNATIVGSRSAALTIASVAGPRCAWPLAGAGPGLGDVIRE
jgi:hypothetical protein